MNKKTAFLLMSLAHTLTGTNIETERLILQQWQEKNIQDFLEIMQNPAVNEPISFHGFNAREKIEAIALKANASIAEKEFGYFACLKKDSQECIGLVGLNYIDRQESPFPCFTVSYILSAEHWGNGYAHEAVKALFKLAFETLNIKEVYACTTALNKKSQQVMERAEMHYVETFDFPGIDKSAPYCQHVLYKITQQEWKEPRTR